MKNFSPGGGGGGGGWSSSLQTFKKRSRRLRSCTETFHGAITQLVFFVFSRRETFILLRFCF